MPTPNSSLSSRSEKLPACDPCRALKLRCDHRRPVCSRCKDRSRAADCVYRPKPFRRPPAPFRRISKQKRVTLEDVATSFASRSGPSRGLDIPLDQYPNPGYLGSSSHTTLFDHLRLGNNTEHDVSDRETGHTSNSQTDCVVDDIYISRGAELILELHRISTMQQFVQVFKSWVATGTNLALAGPLTGPCTSTVLHTLSQCDGTHTTAMAISRNLFYSTRQSIMASSETTFDEYCTNFSGHNSRWEPFGIFFTAVCRASVDLAYAEPLYGSEQQRRKIQKLTLSYSDRCLDLCLPLDCMNDLQLVLQYENFISHSQVDGDQSYLSWRKLGDVAASLFALGYHQQQTETFRAAPLFLRDIRQIAFCRTYSADKNVSIFLGRPPRIIRKFCHFGLPGNHVLSSQVATRRPATWGPTERPDFVTDSRWAALCAIIKEDILDLFTVEDYDERYRRARPIDVDTHAQWNGVPESYRLDCNLKACGRRPVERDFMVNMKLNYLHVQFLLQLALFNPMTMNPNPELVRISLDMLGLVVETVMLKDQIINSGTSLVWKVAYYGLSAAGLISLTLINQSYAMEALHTGMSKVFQDLSILVGEVEHGTLVYVDSPNYSLLVRATQTIKSLLHRMLSPLHNKTTATGNQPIELAESEQMAALDDATWGLWDNNSLQDFEINFWDHLAGHPFLND
ncbi:uncharacterized protein N7443_008985 [Penicillium atrosanguineum]|uniref:uncharacterized protein n=1 Tax=Penicillium atrosanguineum TaxID=1132637 RepID=UPI002383F040|nr:uncharacterized protein N7443_008985 [Penicillium atrosanguineum]KAJ5293032.1 hypothetical protein N7443_008985 [Penicillium atrosanguineum]